MNDIDRSLILGALDSLALALADYNHVWTEGERAIYDEARELLGAEPIGDDDDEGEGWKV
jgi:hypothetical protein